MTALDAAPRGPIPLRAHDLVARARTYFRNGLCLSGAIHLAMVASFLAITAKDPEVMLRPEYDRPTIVDRASYVPPPSAEPGTASSKSENGEFVPVDEKVVSIDAEEILENSIGSVRGEPGDRTGEQEAFPPPGAPGGSDEPAREYDVKNVQVRPVAIYDPKPQYPEWAREVGITGTVLVELLVGEDGSVRRAVVVNGPNALHDAARTGLIRWRFRPGLQNGKPVPVRVQIPVIFTLD